MVMMWVIPSPSTPKVVSWSRARSAFNAWGWSAMTLWVYDQIRNEESARLTDGGDDAPLYWFVPCLGWLRPHSYYRIQIRYRGQHGHLALQRLYGSLDSSFGSNGRRIYRNAAGGNDDDWGSSVAIDSSDRIVVAGVSRNGKCPGAMTWSSGAATLMARRMAHLGAMAWRYMTVQECSIPLVMILLSRW